jgi:hypothetical protein
MGVFRFPWAFRGGVPASTRAALTAFLELEPSAQTAIKQAVKDVGFPFRTRKMTEKAHQLHEELKLLDAEALFAVIDVITDLTDLPTSAVHDVLGGTLSDIGVSFAALESVVKEISEDPQILRQRATEQFKRLAIPGLARMEHFCAIRARFDKQFRYSEESIESYDPKIADHHPVVVVNFELDAPRKSLVFQLDEERLDRLISDLIAAQRELKVLVESRKVREEPHGE